MVVLASMGLHWTFVHGGWLWPSALAALVTVAAATARRPAASVPPPGPARSRLRRLLQRISLSAALGCAVLWAVGAMAERTLPNLVDPDSIESAEHLNSLTGLRVMAVTPFHRGEALDTLEWKLRLVPFSASRRAMQEHASRVHGDCEARLSHLIDYRDYKGVLAAGCSTEQTRKLEATAAFFSDDLQRASDLIEQAEDVQPDDEIRIHLLAGKPERATQAAIAARDRFRERAAEEGDKDFERWSIAYDCLAAGLDANAGTPRLDELYTTTRAIECRLLQAWRASGEQRKGLLEGSGDDATFFEDTPFETAAHLMFVELEPACVDCDARRVASELHVLGAAYGTPTNPLERAALDALERAPVLPPGPKVLRRRLRIRTALDDAYFHRFDEARQQLAVVDVTPKGLNVEHARAVVELWAGDLTAAAAHDLSDKWSAEYARTWLAAARGQPVEEFGWGFEYIESALGPSRAFPPALYEETAMIDGFLRTLAPLGPFLPRDALADYMHAATLSRLYKFDPEDAMTYLVDLAHIHDATGNRELAQRRLSTAEMLREAWTTDNAVPLVVLDNMTSLVVNGASSNR